MAWLVAAAFRVDSNRVVLRGVERGACVRDACLPLENVDGNKHNKHRSQNED